MATTDDALETYTHLPVHIDPASKRLSVTSSDKSVQEAIAIVNALHGSFKNLETANNVPPPPVPVNPKRSAQINKLRESAGQSAKKGQFQEAIRLLGVAIDMAATRPGWEPSGLAREELGLCYLARAAANAEANNFVEGWKDAEASTECKRGPQTGPQGQKIPGNPRAFIIGGKCLMEMSRFDEAVKWFERAIEIEGRDGVDGAQLVLLLTEAKRKAES
jgi:translocation protein SEC72